VGLGEVRFDTSRGPDRGSHGHPPGVLVNLYLSLCAEPERSLCSEPERSLCAERERSLCAEPEREIYGHGQSAVQNCPRMWPANLTTGVPRCSSAKCPVRRERPSVGFTERPTSKFTARPALALLLTQVWLYRGDSKLRTRTALGPYGRPMPTSIGPPWGRCVSLISSNPCTESLLNGPVLVLLRGTALALLIFPVSERGEAARSGLPTFPHDTGVPRS